MNLRVVACMSLELIIPPAVRLLFPLNILRLHVLWPTKPTANELVVVLWQTHTHRRGTVAAAFINQ